MGAADLAGGAQFGEQPPRFRPVRGVAARPQWRQRLGQTVPGGFAFPLSVKELGPRDRDAQLQGPCALLLSGFGRVATACLASRAFEPDRAGALGAREAGRMARSSGSRPWRICNLRTAAIESECIRVAKPARRRFLRFPRSARRTKKPSFNQLRVTREGREVIDSQLPAWVNLSLPMYEPRSRSRE